MTRQSKDDDEPTSSSDATPAEEGIARLEQALAAETETSAALRASLDTLRAKVDQLEADFTQRLGDATRRSTTAEHKLADQQQRLVALGNGREETMRLLAETRAELARVSAERDEIRKQLARIDGMQSSTIALTEEDKTEEQSIHRSLPSIEDLMANLSSIEEGGARVESGHLEARVRLDDEESQEMIAPELVFPEEFGDDDQPNASAAGPTSRVLVYLDAEQPIKYPLYKKVMTIGRSDQADIQVNSDFISRVHARLVSTDGGVVIEDVDSKNGIKVNSRLTDRHTLRHGDVLGLGRHRFTFVDLAANPADH